MRKLRLKPKSGRLQTLWILMQITPTFGIPNYLFSASLWNEIIYTNSHDTIDEFQLKAKCCVFMIWNWFVLMLLFSILFNLFTKFLLEYFVKGIARMRKTKPRAQSMQSDMKRRIYKWIIITLIKSIQLNAYRVGNIEMTRVARQNFM